MDALRFRTATHRRIVSVRRLRPVAHILLPGRSIRCQLADHGMVAVLARCGLGPAAAAAIRETFIGSSALSRDRRAAIQTQSKAAVNSPPSPNHSAKILSTVTMNSHKQWRLTFR